MEQTTLFPMANHIVGKLTDYAIDVRQEIFKLDEAIDKKRGEKRVLAETLADIELAIKEAMTVAAELTPPPDHDQDIVDIVQPEGFGEAPDAEQEPEG